MTLPEKEIIKTTIEEQPQRLKKMLILFLTCFLLLLILSYFLFNPFIFTLLSGFTETNTLNEENLLIIKKGTNFIFEKEVYLQLKELFIKNEGQEFKTCILGKKEETTYHLTSLFTPEIYSQEFTKVVSAPCPAGTLIDVHSHPQNHCIPSYHDLQVLKRLKEENPEIILAVMCNLNKFNLYK